MKETRGKALGGRSGRCRAGVPRGGQWEGTVTDSAGIFLSEEPLDGYFFLGFFVGLGSNDET